MFFCGLHAAHVQLDSDHILTLLIDMWDVHLGKTKHNCIRMESLKYWI